jgi:hypothetical protein
MTDHILAAEEDEHEPEPCASCTDSEADCQECPYWDDDEPTEPRIPPFILFKRTPTRSEH